MSQISALRARATELKITFDQRWGENKLKAAIAAEEEARGIMPEPESNPVVEQEQPVATEQAEPVAEPEKVAEPVQEQAETEQPAAADTGDTEQSKQDDENADNEQPDLPETEETKLVSEADVETLKVKNISPNPMTIGFVFKAKPGFTVTLTGNQLTDKLRKKIAYGVELGLLELV